MAALRAILVLAALAAGTAPQPVRAEATAVADAETRRWLQQYVRIDTSNPPGNEHRAVGFLASILRSEGVPVTVLAPPDGRPTLLARLPATAPAGPAAGAAPGDGALVLLHHTDVVPPGDGWSVDPFAGGIADGVLWGRGAIDAKSLGVAHLAAFLELHRRGTPLSRDLVFLAVPDEEAGGERGAGWLLEHRAELLGPVAAVLNEGGANRALGDRLHWWGIEVAQKRPLWLEVRATGREGHGSTLDLHTAPHRLIRALDRLLERPLDFRLTPEVESYFRAVRPYDRPAISRVLSQLPELLSREGGWRRLPPGIPNYLLDSVQVNVLEAGERINSKPPTATALVDVRLLPDADADAFLGEVGELLAPEATVHVLLRAPRAPPSPTDTAIFRRLEEVLGEEAPVVPAFIPGVTDSRWFRERGIPAYGFSPFVLEGTAMRGIHGADERIDLDAFRRGVERTKRVVEACVGR